MTWTNEEPDCGGGGGGESYQPPYNDMLPAPGTPTGMSFSIGGGGGNGRGSSPASPRGSGPSGMAGMGSTMSAAEREALVAKAEAGAMNTGKRGSVTRGQYAPTGPDGKPLPLPKDANGNLQPDSRYPHTQLGTRQGRNGSYRQSIEFDAEGKPVRRIDWTDHGRPNGHTNPHQHIAEPTQAGIPPTSTGGSFKWGTAQPLTNGPN